MAFLAACGGAPDSCPGGEGSEMEPATAAECDSICGSVPGAGSEVTCEGFCRCTCPGSGLTETTHGPYPLSEDATQQAAQRFAKLCGL